MPIYYRRNQNTELTCDQYDSTLDALLNRANHTGTQLSSTISDLHNTVAGYDFITALQTCCTTLTNQLNDLQNSLFGDGELSTIVNNLRTELLGDIATVQTSLTALTGRVTIAEGNITTLTTNISTLSSQIQALQNTKADINSPTFTGNPKVPTPLAGDNSTSIANTAFVTSAITANKAILLLLLLLLLVSPRGVRSD
jgi:chromosome segregation ATPase